MSIFLFYGSRDNTLFLESTFENSNFYDDLNFIWWCRPLDSDSCPSCPSESESLLFYLIYFN